MSSTIPFTGRRACTAVDPAPGQVGQRGQVRLLGQHLGLEAAHLAGGGCSLRHGPATHDPAHGRIMRQPVGIVHVLVSGEPPEDGLAKLSDQRVAAILAGPGVGEDLSGQVCQAKRIIEIPKGEQTSVGRDPRAMELQLQAGVEGDPESGIALLHPPHRPSPAPLTPATSLHHRRKSGSHLTAACASGKCGLNSRDPSRITAFDLTPMCRRRGFVPSVGQNGQATGSRCTTQVASSLQRRGP